MYKSGLNKFFASTTAKNVNGLQRLSKNKRNLKEMGCVASPETGGALKASSKRAREWGLELISFYFIVRLCKLAKQWKWD